ncbi:pyridoxal phosphate phosphatase PHOSPHO2-like isoform X2 [Uranotaenia lowii]|nr:pyridoxal phosphate phosphatase PHOSPHO2-like isoform X2 [Uranotaenia lowii]XP_055606733.1 pyridoxal phosphate phosphatase PHOSPHO2-like isoform X2 [Uranotaenia lowii]
MSTNEYSLKNLAAFDFDHTICEHNTDIIVRNLLDQSLITPEIKGILRSSGWIPYMQRIFRILHLHKFTATDISSAIKSIPEVQGIKKCIENLANNNFHIIIISDSNSEFIKTWNDFNGISDYIHTIFTNPANFNKDGLLELFPYHHQTECSLSSKNLCKGKILENFLNKQYSEAQIKYDKIFYIGDGKNDVCPMLRLKENGFACPRDGYSCSEELNNAISKLPDKYEGKIINWSTGSQLFNDICKEL